MNTTLQDRLRVLRGKGGSFLTIVQILGLEFSTDALFRHLTAY
jgi:hypothetical protein